MEARDEQALAAVPGTRWSHAAGALALALLAAGWAALRLQMNGEYKGAPWAEIADLSAPLPFGHRVLVPLLAWPLRAATGWPLALVWGVFEAAAALALWLALRAALRPHVPVRWDMALATGFFALLPLAFLLKHKWAVFYPWDTPAMAFTAGGLALVEARRFGPAVALCLVAALNRESAALIPAAALALHVERSSGHVPDDRRDASAAASPDPLPADPPPRAAPPTGPDPTPRVVASPTTGAATVGHTPVLEGMLRSAGPVNPPADSRERTSHRDHIPPRITRASGHVLRDLRRIAGPALAMLAAVAAGRLAVAWALPDNPGRALHFSLGKDTPRWLHNLQWLGEPLHWLWLPTYFTFLPLLWALLWRQLAPQHRRLGLVAAAYFAALMPVANIYEPRVYGEILVLLYLPAAVGLCRWLRGAATLPAA